MKRMHSKEEVEEIVKESAPESGTKLYLHRLIFSDYFYRYNVLIGETSPSGTPFDFSNGAKGAYAQKDLIVVSPKSEPFSSLTEISSYAAHVTNFNAVIEHETNAYKIISRPASSLLDYILAVRIGDLTSSSFTLFGFRYSTNEFTDTVTPL